MNLIFYDDPEKVVHLRPFTFTRPVADIRMGILTVREKWQLALGKETSSTYTEDHLASKYPLHIAGTNRCISSDVLPDAALVQAIRSLQVNEMLFAGNDWIAGVFTEQMHEEFDAGRMEAFTRVEYSAPVHTFTHTWDIFSQCGREIAADFAMLTAGRTSQPLSASNTVIGDPSLVFLEEGARVEGAWLNTTGGPIYLDKDAEIMEGCMVRGPFALGEHSALKMGAKIYGPSSFGPHCKVGGEVNNSVIFGYSNKAHDGFLGNSVLGEWCNIGADSNNSNLKNNYAEVKLWHYGKKSFIRTGLQFCGLIMGDHSKCGINTMFNTGTVVGVSANIFGSGFPRNFIPSFSWGGAGGLSEYKLADAIATAKLVYARRNMEFDETEQEIFRYIHALGESA